MIETNLIAPISGSWKGDHLSGRELDNLGCLKARIWRSLCARNSITLFASAHLLLHTAMCNNIHMATNLALDDRLIEEARRIGRHKTKREAVSAALAEYVKRRKQLRILEAFGTIDFDPKYNYKIERRRKRS